MPKYKKTLSEGRKPGTGRPRFDGHPVTTLTPELIEAIADEVREGTPPEIARKVLRVSQQLWQTWKKAAADGSPLHQQLFEELEYAEAECFAWHNKNWRRSSEEGGKGWIGSCTYLERRLPDFYAKQDKRSHDIRVTQITAAVALQEAAVLVQQEATAITYSPTPQLPAPVVIDAREIEQVVKESVETSDTQE